MRALFFFFAFFFYLYNFSEQLSNPLEADGSTIIDGCIHPISGDYIISEVDLVAHGYEPIYIQRTYISSQQSIQESFWTIFPHLYLILEPTFNKKEPKKVTLHEPCGTKIEYKNTKENPLIFTPNFSDKFKGITNTSKNIISGKTNLKNYHLIKDKKSKCYVLTAPDGTIRYYKKVSEQWYAYLIKERKRNGNVIIYSYDENYEIKKIESKNPSETITYAAVTFEKVKGKNSIHVTTHLQDQVTYAFEPHQKEEHLLNGKIRKIKLVESTLAPKEKIFYSELEKTKSVELVSKRVVENTPVQEISYYGIGVNQTRYESTKIKSALDPRYKRVKEIKEPLGKGEQLVTTHTFVYELGKFAKEEKVRNYSRLSKELALTHHFDGFGNKTTYGYSDYFVPLFKRKYLEDQKTIGYQELFFWELKDNINYLKCKIFADQNEVYLKKFYEYDRFGNIVKQTLIGNFSGKNMKALSFSDKEESAHEKIITTYTYDTKDFHNLIGESRSNGLSYEYLYEHQTNLLKAKYTLYKGLIKYREFFFYNEDFVCIKLISDNGSSYSENNLSDVSEREIEHRILSKDLISYNLPKEIQTYAFDKEKQKTSLLKKKKLIYTARGQLQEEKTLDDQERVIQTISYFFDERNRLIKKEDSTQGEFLYCYNNLNHLIQEVRPSSPLPIQYKRNYLGQIEEKIWGEKKSRYSYDLKKRIHEMEDDLGNTTKFEYCSLDYEIKKSIYNAQGVDQFEISSIIKKKDLFGNTTVEINEKNERTEKVYSSHGKILKITYPDQSFQQFFYNLDGELEKEIQKDGSSNVYVHDYLSRIIKKSSYSKNQTFLGECIWRYEGANLTSFIDIDHSKTLYLYDSFGRKIEEKKYQDQELIFHKTFGYSSLDQITYEGEYNPKNPNQIQKIYKIYNSKKELTQERVEDELSHVISTKHFKYDSFGNLIEKSAEFENGLVMHKFFFDLENRLVKEIDEENNITEISYQKASFDHQERRYKSSVVIKKENQIVQETFNSQNKLVEKFVFDKNDSPLVKHQYIYDKMLNLVEEKITSYQSGCLSNLSFKKEYNFFNQIIKCIESFEGKNDQTTLFSYNLSDRLTSAIKPDGTKILYSYNDFNNLCYLTSSDQSICYEFIYDANQNLIEEKDHINKTSTKKEYDKGKNIRAEILANNLKIEKEYDGFSRKTALILPDRSRIEYVYETFFLNEIKRVNQEGKELYSHQILDRACFGKIKKEKLIDQSSFLSTEYESFGRKKSLTSDFHDHEILLVKNKLIYKDRLFISKKEKERNYFYDELNHLIKEEGFYNHCYGFDSFDTRISKDSKPYLIGQNNQIVSDGKFSYEYNLNGCRSKKSIGNSPLCYVYDALDRLTQINTKSIQIHFTYDSWHRRLSKKIYKLSFFGTFYLHDEELYLYDDFHEIGSFSSKLDKKDLKVLSSEDPLKIIAIEIESSSYLPLQDLFGNVIALIDINSKNQIESYFFSSFGEVTVKDRFDFYYDSSPVKNKWLYQGKRFEPESGLIYFGRRYYDPSVGSWLTKDPLGIYENPNFYQYCQNNPLCFLDDLGFSSQTREPSICSNEPSDLFFQNSNLDTPFNDQLPSYKPAPFPKGGNFTQYTPYTSSRIYQGQGMIQPLNERFFFINGINTSLAEATMMRNSCSMNLRMNVDLFYNETEGAFKDLRKLSHFHKRVEKSIVDDLRKCIIHEISQGKTVHIFAHSCGGLIASNALEKIPEEYKDKTFVTTFGSAKYIPKIKDLGNIQNFISKRDLIAISSNVWHAAINFNHPSLKNLAHGDVPVTYLDPHCYSVVKEHSFMGQTYQTALKKVCENFYKLP